MPVRVRPTASASSCSEVPAKPFSANRRSAASISWLITISWRTGLLVVGLAMGSSCQVTLALLSISTLTLDGIVDILTCMSHGSFVGYSQGESDTGLVDFSDHDRETFRGLGVWSGRTLAEELAAAARVHSASTALVTTEARWTYRELLTRSEALARGLQSTTDLRPGDPVMFQMGNVAETVIAYLGALLAGVGPAATPPRHAAPRGELIAHAVGARACLGLGEPWRGE